ncbi:MAG: hypothetical protein KKD28_07195 [Chloroflexi bacterium]|nr:hypothetical protein [Chloroflexota bacterium]
MLELILKQLNDSKAQVLLDGIESHIFELNDLRLADEAQVRAFADNPNEYGQRLYAALFRENSPAEAALHALPKNPGPQPFSLVPMLRVGTPGLNLRQQGVLGDAFPRRSVGTRMLAW